MLKRLSKRLVSFKICKNKPGSLHQHILQTNALTIGKELATQSLCLVTKTAASWDIWQQEL